MNEPVREILRRAALGLVPWDHRLLKDLTARPDEAIPAVLAEATGPRDHWRIDILPDLLNLTRHFQDPRLMPFLIELLQDEEPFEETFEALAALGGQAVEPLIEAFPKARKSVRTEIAFALSALGVRDPRIEAIIRQQAEADPDEGGVALELYAEPGEKVLEPFDLFEEYPDHDLPVFEVLTVEERIGLLESPEEEVRVAAAASLYREEFSRQEEDVLFRQARADSSAHVRGQLWQALEGATDRDDVRQAMLAALSSAGVPVAERCGALVGLAAHAKLPEVAAAILEFYQSPETRLKALEAMWRSLDRAYAGYFPRHLDDPDPDIRRVSLRGCGTMGLAAELGRIRAFLKDDDVREDALFAYAMVAPSKVSPAYLRPLLKKLEKEAGGYREDEEEIVRMALDERLKGAGKDPVFVAEYHPEEEED
jgi:HEAT repeat protein